MRLENIISLTNAKLLNEPFVSEFSQIVFDASKVKRGDLFVAYDTSKVSEALTNGAYAILFDKPLQIADNEVAWLKVSSLDNALLRLLRFRFVEKEIEAYGCDPIVYALAKEIDTFGSIIIASEDTQELIQTLWNITPKSKILFNDDFQYKNILFVEPKSLPTHHKYTISVIEKTLFEISFILNDRYYEEIYLSPYFVAYLEKLLNFYLELKIPFKLRRFEMLEYFQILFINKNFEQKEQGSSEKVLFFEKDERYFRSQIAFLSSFAPWAKILYILPVAFSSLDRKNCYYYKDEDEILEYLEKEDYLYAYIGGIDKNILDRYQVKKPQQLTFF